MALPEDPNEWTPAQHRAAKPAQRNVAADQLQEEYPDWRDFLWVCLRWPAQLYACSSAYAWSWTPSPFHPSKPSTIDYLVRRQSSSARAPSTAWATTTRRPGAAQPFPTCPRPRSGAQGRGAMDGRGGRCSRGRWDGAGEADVVDVLAVRCWCRRERGPGQAGYKRAGHPHTVLLRLFGDTNGVTMVQTTKKTATKVRGRCIYSICAQRWHFCA
jgi:hypothetical protein